MRNVIKLGFEEDFFEYIELLAKINREEKLTVLVASHDTPCGSAKFTGYVAMKLCRALGTRTLLNDKYRYSYAAVIDRGVVKYEGAEPDEAVDFECEIGGRFIRVSSANYNLKEKLESDYMKYPRLVAGSHNYVRESRRGLHITVLDSITGDFYDSVCFDTYKPEITSKRFGMKIYQTGLDDWKRRNPGVTFLSIEYPIFPQTNLSKHEEYILKNGICRADYEKDPDSEHNILLETFPDRDAVLEVLTPPKSYTATDGTRKDFETHGRFVNSENGHRITAGNPDKPKRTIYFIGFCRFFGYAARDENTIESVLQSMLNENAPDENFTVQNYGYYLWFVSVLKKRYELLKILDSIFPKPGDIVFIDKDENPDIMVDCSLVGLRPHSHGEIFIEAWYRPFLQRGSHLTENGYNLVAGRVFETLRSHDFFRDAPRRIEETKPEKITRRDPVKIAFTLEERFLLEKYKKVLSDFYDSLVPQYGKDFRMGSIVMSGGPFTLGHRYLVETAASKVDFLLVFVVAEDKSDFTFEDRIRLVDEGTSDLPNVGIIGSTKFIISTPIFATHLTKEDLRGVVIDSSVDIIVFAQEIAPAANIKVRFVGTEPFDTVTLQYNRTLEHILPEYGIELSQIPRKEIDGVPISASLVRKYLAEQNFAAIAELVPKSTLDFLGIME